MSISLPANNDKNMRYDIVRIVKQGIVWRDCAILVERLCRRKVFGLVQDALWLSDTDESRITVSAWLDGNPWEDSLGREIIIEDFDNSRIAKTEAIIGKKVVVPNSADISLAEIAACCIWETSFYAFLPHDWESLGMRLHLSCYDEAKVFRHCIEKYGKFIPSRKEMMNIRSFHNKIRREMKFYHSRRYSKFDSKFLGCEKRKRRMWKRWEINEEYKKRIVNTAEFIDDLHERGINLSEPPTTEQLSVLFHSPACWIGCWHTKYKYLAQASSPVTRTWNLASFVVHKRQQTAILHEGRWCTWRWLADRFRILQYVI